MFMGRVSHRLVQCELEGEGVTSMGGEGGVGSTARPERLIFSKSHFLELGSKRKRCRF